MISILITLNHPVTSIIIYCSWVYSDVPELTIKLFNATNTIMKKHNSMKEAALAFELKLKVTMPI